MRREENSRNRRGWVKGRDGDVTNDRLRAVNTEAVASADDAPGARLVLFQLPGLAVFAAIVTLAAWFGMNEIVVLAALVLAVGLVSRGWAALALVGLSYERRLDADRAFPGETLTLRLTLDNRKFLPLSWVRVEETLSPALARPGDPAVTMSEDGTSAKLAIVTPLAWYRSATLTRTIDCRRRGCYTIGPARLLSADVFGLFVRARIAAPEIAILVYPRLYPVADPVLPARHPIGPDRDPRRLFEDLTRPAGVREYTSDTPFKTINWKASARTGRLHATVYETTVTQETVLLLAVDSFAGEGDDAAFEMAVSAVASIACRELDLGRPVGIFANGEQAQGHGPVYLAPGLGPDRRRILLEALARLERRSGTAFPAFLDRATPDIGSRARLIAVVNRADEAVLARLHDFTRRGRQVALLTAAVQEQVAGGLACRRISDVLSREVAA
jgi:uncharacterized protein (DUF58 family)